MLDVRRLVLLRDLATYGTVTAVAEIHQVTPSAISQQLRVLEGEAGVSLLHREGRTVRLTAAGSALVGQSEHVLAALEQAQSTVLALDEEIGGELLIGCFPSGLAQVAAPLVAELAGRYPRLRPRVVEAQPEESLPMLKRRDLDLTLNFRYPHLGTPLPDGLTARRLFDDQLAVAVPEELRTAVERDGLGVLRRERWTTAPEPSACRDVTLHACQSAGFTPVIEHTFWDLRAALPLAAAGAAVTILPGLMCADPPEGVAILPLPGKSRSIEAVFRTGSADHPAIAAALDILGDLGQVR